MSNDGAYAIETSGLSRSFGARTVVNGLGLVVPKGGVYGFLGPNGAGKTTTIRMLLGLIRPSGGRVRLLGAELNRESLRRVGSLVEWPSLYPHLSGRENLEVTRRMVGAPATALDRALERVSLVRDSRRLVREYSQGMKQRLGLALALLNDPELLILDEPTNGLDPAGIREMRELLVRLPVTEGVTVFLSSHLLSEVEQMASTVCIVNQGRAVFQGPLEELRQRQEARVKVGVEGGRASEALAAVAEMGLTGTQVGGQWLSIAGAEPARVGWALWRKGFEISHLSLESRSLEEVFLAMTGGAE